MIFDSTNLFSDAQAVTASAASTNVIDLGATDTPKHAAAAIVRDIGKGTPIQLRVQVVANFNTLTSIVVGVQTDTADSFGSATTVLSSPAVPLASLVAGYVFPITIVPRGTLERYVRLYYTVAGTAATLGQITAGFVFANDEREF